MCLAVPGRIVSHGDEEAIVDLAGNRLTVSTVLTPQVGPGDWVLIHAGFTITQVSENDARTTWEYLADLCEDPLSEAGEEQQAQDERTGGP